ncbi:embryonic protein DC-8 isoform X2 [Arabidopsis lyrata subsp. lyrata]|uniref:embryonic protein DC-8 isoform X2 n=1 Tax=Arabidopsis lyrata subsp. lyrata TaxID=81972 RepID=UPI000A29D2FD|nr:embryonic protein DC-8 isoform X2 [Arabidopsis lyrata subsp. lyrata]|eukprot:XP_020885460.1 embryonic protein DC-8 isoform X2 [Arabidopsis lyrata subsp. lyrata]
MASEQAKRENKVTEREVQVEKDRVPKMTSHFESMAEKGKDFDTQRHQTEGGGTQFVSLSDKGSNMSVSNEGEGETKMKRTQMPHSVGKFVTSSESGPGKKKDEKEHEKASLEDIHGYRANAQQKSMDTIRAAEERYNKAKESLSHGGQEGRGGQMEGKGRDSGVRVSHVGAVGGDGGGAAVFGHESRGKEEEGKESGVHGFHGEKARHAELLAAGGEEMREREGKESAGGVGGRSVKDTVAEKGRQAKESVGQGAQKAGSAASEKTQRASGYLTEKARETGDVAAQKGQEAKEQAARAKEYTVKKAAEAKDMAAEKAQRASEYATEKGKEAGNVTAEQAARAKDYALQKAVEAKETAAEKAQRASEYMKETGSTAAEQAARAKDYTLQKAVEAKDVAAEKAQRASEYMTETGKQAGNVAAQKGQEAASMTAKAKDYTVQKAGEAAGYIKETTVEGGKGAAHYAGVAAEKAAAVGWTAAHFTTEKVVQGTKAVAGTVEGAVGYAGHKAVEVGSKAVDLTKEKAAVAADTVVGYTARKKEEAQHRDQEMHQVRKRSDQGLLQKQREAMEKSTEKKEGVRKMSMAMDQKARPEKRGETLERRSTEEEGGVRKMSSDMDQKARSENRGDTLERNTEEEEAVRDMSKKKGLEREGCLGQSARL